MGRGDRKIMKTEIEIIKVERGGSFVAEITFRTKDGDEYVIKADTIQEAKLKIEKALENEASFLMMYRALLGKKLQIAPGWKSRREDEKR